MPSTAPITGGRVLVSRTGESTTGSRSRWTWGRWVRLEALQDVVGGWVVISCCCLVAKSCLTVCDPMDHSTLDFPDLHHLLEFAQSHAHWVGDAIQPISSSVTFVSSLPSLFPSIRVFSNELAPCIRWPKYWSFSFSISPSNEYSGLISFRIDWFHLLAVQMTLKSLL